MKGPMFCVRCRYCLDEEEKYCPLCRSIVDLVDEAQAARLCRQLCDHFGWSPALMERSFAA